MAAECPLSFQMEQVRRCRVDWNLEITLPHLCNLAVELEAELMTEWDRYCSSTSDQVMAGDIVFD